MPTVLILVFSAAGFLMLCVAVSRQTPTSEFKKADLLRVRLNTPLLVQQKRKHNNFLNCNDSRVQCTNNFEKLEFGRCSAQSWPGWNHGKPKEPYGNISALFYEPVGPDGEPVFSGPKALLLPDHSPGQNGYPSTGEYPWPNGLVNFILVPDPNPFGVQGQERWFSFGETHLDDYLVAQDQRWWQFNQMRDASVTIQYPLNSYDVDTIVSYCIISITSDNELANAYIIGGGISQSFIEINLYVYSTRLFGWAAQVYAFY